MPELPDVDVYAEALEKRIAGQPLQNVRVISPFLLRSVDPPVEAALDKAVVRAFRMGKRIVIEQSGCLYWIIHLIIAGRLRWLEGASKPPARITSAIFGWPTGRLAITEAGTRKRASLYLVAGKDELARHDPGGLEVLEADLPAFAGTLTRENHTLKRALTDPRLFSGIGNAYSDEILHAARCSPIALTARLDEETIARIYDAARRVLGDWKERLRGQFGDRFPGPGQITAFRPEFAVHGKFGKKCRACGTQVQRIRYAENETNYCPTCQTGGKVLADRSLSRLLKDDWPRRVLDQEPQ
jgi:formamidopyrimidine-DNA glycosylase